MSKIKEFLQLLGSNKKNIQKLNNQGKLETDAAPVYDNDNNNQQTLTTNQSITNSTELTNEMVQELSDPNYNSMNLTPQQNNNTMNVNNAQQQVVMHFNNANNVHFGAVYNFKGQPQMEDVENIQNLEENKRRLTPHKTTTIVAMMQSQEEPNARLLDIISTHLGEGWKQIMRDLGHTEGQIEQAIIDHQIHGNIKEVIYQLLLQWLQSADDGVATLGRITTLLWERNHRECVQRMKLVWKDSQKSGNI